MRRTSVRFLRLALLALTAVLARAESTVFFDSCQTSTLEASEVTSDTILSGGYLVTYTRDKLFTGGTGQPIGRPVRVAWPAGVEAQAVTTPPPGNTDYKARITLRRADGQPFDLTALTFKLLANTAGAGGSLEIMPLLGGEEAFNDPLYFDASGYYGSTFHYDASPNPWGSTALLHAFEAYKLGLYVDFALIALTLDSAAPDAEACCFAAGDCADLIAGACAGQGGASLGPGTTCSCNPCAPPAGPPPAPDGRQGTSPLRASRVDSSASIEVRWDVISCTATDYNLIYGRLDSLSGYTLQGAACSLGTTGTYLWTAVPADDLYFLVLGTDGTVTESSWGVNGANEERNGALSSSMCGMLLKDATRTCP